jgi:hypothetical protein
MAAGAAHASDLPPSLTLNLPIPVNLATPTWLGHPTTPATTFATLDLPILTPDPTASLLVTVYFQEKEGGFMRIVWNGAQGAQVLSENFYENIGMANQRSLLISPASLIGDGVLVFQCGDSKLGIQRIKLEWLETKTSLVSPEILDTLVTPSSGVTQSAQDVSGAPTGLPSDAWQNQIVSVPLADQPVRIEQGVEFSIDLDKVPVVARLGFKEAGLSLGKHFVVWINEQRAGTVTPAVPDLKDAGFITNTDASTHYLGWRDGSFSVPTSLLKPGVNTVQLADEDDMAPATGQAATTASPTNEAPLAVKNIALQLNYTPVPDKTDAQAPQLLLGPAGTIAPVPTTTSPENPIP